MKRVFIGIKVTAGSAFTGHISSVKAGLANESVKWTDPENIHITLAFLGNTEENTIPSIKNMLKRRCTGFGSFDLQLSGIGVFKNLKDPKIIWTGISGAGRLKELNSTIIEGLRETGIKVEDRPFSPHLTIGRVRHIDDLENLKNIIDKYRDTRMQEVPVNEVILYESILKQAGPVYMPLSVYKIS